MMINELKQPPFNLPTNKLDPEIRKLLAEIQRRKRPGGLTKTELDRIRRVVELKYPITKPIMPKVKLPNTVPNIPQVENKLGQFKNKGFGLGRAIAKQLTR